MRYEIYTQHINTITRTQTHINLPLTCILATLIIALINSLPFLSTSLNNGTINSSKNGTASPTPRLLYEINALAARGVSGNNDVINMCSNEPQECPTPTTGTAPYSV